MALGQWKVIPSNTAIDVRVPSGNYLWPTIRVLNPNDGVLYIKQNGPIVDTGYGSWDYKCPAQSFGLLPSEGEGWQSAGLYYQDQSGSGRPGEIAIYLSNITQAEPAFVAIGRSLLTQLNSMDIAEGTAPSPPASGYCRIWADVNGNLFHMHSDNSDPEIWDTRLQLVGAITGTCLSTAFTIPMLVPGMIRSTALGSNFGGTGPGAEVSLNPGSPSVAQLIGYDRTANTYLPVSIAGSTISLAAQSGSLTLTGTPVNITQGSVNKVTAWTGNVNFNTSAPPAPWTETPVSVTATLDQAGWVRVECYLTVYNTVANTGVYIGYGWDGTVQASSGYVAQQNAGGQVPANFSFLANMTAGTHRFSVFMGAAGGTAYISQTTGQAMWCTQLRA